MLLFLSYMDMPNNNEDNRHVIQLKTCPRCKTAIRRSLRYGNVVKQQLLDIEKVKAKVNGNEEEIEAMKKELEIRLNDLKRRFDAEDEMKEWDRLKGRLEGMSNKLMAAVTTNQVMLMERFCVMNQKLKENLLILPQSKVTAESRLEGIFTCFSFCPCGNLLRKNPGKQVPFWDLEPFYRHL